MENRITDNLVLDLNEACESFIGSHLEGKDRLYMCEVLVSLLCRIGRVVLPVCKV